MSNNNKIQNIIKKESAEPEEDQQDAAYARRVAAAQKSLEDRLQAMIAAKMAEPKPEVVDPLQQELAREQEKLKRKMALLKAEVEALRRLTMPHGQAPVKEEEEGEKVKAEDI